jgi:hypothetical protein
VITRRLATATFEYRGKRGDSMVGVGETGDDPLPGATTVEGFGLVLDPFRRELRPMQLPLKEERTAVSPKKIQGQPSSSAGRTAHRLPG